MHVKQYPWLLKSIAFWTIYCSVSNTCCTLKCHCWREQAKTVTKGFVHSEAENHTCTQASRNTHPRCRTKRMLNLHCSGFAQRSSLLLTAAQTRQGLCLPEGRAVLTWVHPQEGQDSVTCPGDTSLNGSGRCLHEAISIWQGSCGRAELVTHSTAKGTPSG